ncbi:hypothetical protein [Bacillus sp. FJAT-22090]|uniref:hypothetical protein n=1 Tax=Bacillus sp. FJAT-22090 TaxID=1581038 RepID=UPI0011A288E0|nr:hypothetical protein [Bacillus sp. FJAT-22090]
MTKTNKEPMEFSKKILYVTFFIAIIIILFAMAMIYLMITGNYVGDSSSLNTLLGGLFTEISVGTSFYYWKARKENTIKLENQYGVTTSEIGDDINEFNN